MHAEGLTAWHPWRGWGGTPLPTPPTSVHTSPHKKSVRAREKKLASGTRVCCADNMPRRQRVNELPEGAVACELNPKYFVTRDGRVFSAIKGERDLVMLRPAVNNLGYHKVSLTLATGKKRLCSVHRLVATAFIPNPEGKPEVNHKDLDKLNNQDANLEWMTHAENLAHARAALGNWSPKNVPATCTRVVGFPIWPETDKLNKGKVLDFISIRTACDHFGKKYSTFAPVLCRAMAKEWRAYGYWWRLA